MIWPIENTEDLFSESFFGRLEWEGNSISFKQQGRQLEELESCADFAKNHGRGEENILYWRIVHLAQWRNEKLYIQVSDKILNSINCHSGKKKNRIPRLETNQNFS